LRASLQLCLSTAQTVRRSLQVRLETQCCFKFRNTLPGFPRRKERQPKVVMGLGTGGIQPQGFAKLINSLWNSTHPRQRKSKVAADVGVLGCQL
jgi:hypothetical protein